MKKKVLIISIILIISIMEIYDFTHYDRSKANIFEIPKTSDVWDSGDIIMYEKYYFIQKSSKTEKEFEEMIWNFIDENDILHDATENGASYVLINFMVADFSLPIWFEEDKNYFVMDDHIAHYIKSNRIALVTFDLDEQTSELIIDDNFS